MKGLRAEWKNLVFINYRVSHKHLLPYLPSGTCIDDRSGDCFVSIVAFCFGNSRIGPFKIPFYNHFGQINFRFYVRRKEGNNQWRDGVTFIRELVPKKTVSWLSRALLKENYSTVPLVHNWKTTGENLLVSTHWNNRGVNHFIAVSAASRPEKATRCELFFGDRKFSYTRQRADKTTELEIAHPTWQKYPIAGYSIGINFENLYGPGFAFLNGITPHSVILFKGSLVRYRQTRTIPIPQRG